ncbi:M24 family metallopeptidase [Candidatus Tisiphia endosymbiont of Nedyus quadrimaculatus]|uniref:M24 family metallopeptidase n=1 Tax=Candidatus Tisiphia endosymbiont of Nedyus quadrimaculatus TaxID=3139332 RepID=UPI00345E69EE
MQERISNIRVLFAKYKIDAYIVPSNDQYLSEYVHESAKRLQYMTNFSGSNGIVVICKNNVIFFTDGRYLEQSKRELDPKIFEIFDIKDLPYFPWDDYLGNDGILGYDAKLFTNVKLKIFSKIKPRLHKVSNNLVDQIWRNRPAEPSSKIYIYDDKFAGQSYSDKITMCRNLLTKYSADTMIVTAADSICWLLNLRASDIPYSPLMLGIVLITKDQLYLFTNPNRVDQDIILARPHITILPSAQFADILSQANKVLIDENFTSNYIIDLLSTKIIEKINDPCQLAKARKNDIEINHAINFHIKDAVALCEFFAYLFELPNLQDQTEYDLGAILTGFRFKQDQYVMDSFPTICGFKENSAIIHYRATNTGAKKILGKGILLIDSGGQYNGCTTDVTRTLAIGGYPTKEQKLRYTQVLKGHIALSMIKFPVNLITGANLDVLARQFLWRDGQDYPHGTGHGVGSFLSVHEGPQNISLRSNVILEPSMIVSNEPGYYKTNEFGIRIENLMYVKNTLQDKNYLEFDTLTLVPYAKDLIDRRMLNADEINYIEQYYQKIKQQVYPLLSISGQKWLSNQLLF